MSLSQLKGIDFENKRKKKKAFRIVAHKYFTIFFKKKVKAKSKNLIQLEC